MNYKGGASGQYWEKFPVNKNRLGKSLIEANAVSKWQPEWDAGTGKS
jgi:hypothetical protein